MAIIQINEEFRVVIDQYNHTLRQLREVTNPKTKETSMKWCFVGYYPSMNYVLRAAINIKLAEGDDTLTMEEYLNKLKSLQEEFSVV